MSSYPKAYRSFALASIMLAFANMVSAQSEQQLKEKIQALLEAQGLTGAVWTLVKDNQQIYTDAVGYHNNPTKTPLRSTDKMLVGSVSKTVLAAGILRMATMGLLNLNDPVKKYLPQLRLQNKWDKTHPVRIRHLLDHTSGLTDVKLWQVFSTTAKPDTPLDQVYCRSPEVLRIQTQPGSIYSYSNIGYNILGKIIEVITQKPYEEYLDQELLQPLGMSNSSFRFISQTDDKRLAWGHLDNGKPIQAMPMYLRAAGQFVTTAEDMGRFLRFMMSDGSINNTPFIRKAFLTGIGKQTATDAFRQGLPYGDALGAYTRDRYGVVGIAKNGNTLGFVSMIYMFPEYQKAFFIVYNTDSETSDYDVFNEALVKHLAVPTRQVITQKQTIDKTILNWSGYYIPVITKVEPFGLMDLLFAHTKLTITQTEAKLVPFQGKQKTLWYQGGGVFSMEGRTNVSHRFYQDEHGNHLITDGFRTIKKTNGIKIIAMATVLFLGILALVYLIAMGTIQWIKNRSVFFRNPLFWIYSATCTLAIAIAFIATQPFMKMGDLTIGNILLAAASILLPAFSLLSIVLLVKKQKDYYMKTSFWAALSVFLLCLLLIANKLMPMFMWK